MRVESRMNWDAGIGIGVLLGLIAAAAAWGPSPVLAGKRDARDVHEARDQREGRDFSWSGRLSRGQRIQINGINGDIVATGTRGSEVEVTATKRARRSDPEDVRIEVTEHGGGVTICALYPNRRGDYRECEPDGSHQDTKNNDVQVQFHVRVPAGVAFGGRTVNGKIEAEGMSGPVDASTVNGSVTIGTEDIGEATTVNGSISASLGASRWADELEFSTVNGSITVDFPPDLSTALTASTVNGTISTDFPMTVRGKFSRRSVSGSVGRNRTGAGALSLSTVNGSIALKSGE